MSDSRLVLYTALVTVLIGGIELVAAQLGTDVPAWFPSFGSTIGTLSVYMSLVSGLTGVLTAAITVGFGYTMARRIDLSWSFRPFLRSVAIGVVVGIVVGFVLIMAVVGSISDLPATTALQTPSDLVGAVVAVVTQIGAIVLSEGITLVALIFAGAALGQFQKRRENASRLDEEPSTTPAAN